MADNRTPGVSVALTRRIGSLLDGGATVSLRRSNLVLRDIVLTRSYGRETPAAVEVCRQVGNRGLDPEAFSLDRWRRDAPERAGNMTIARDRNNVRHMITRRRAGQQVATNAGRRFYHSAPLAQWIVNVPIISRRNNTGSHFNPRYIQVNDAFLRAMERHGYDIQDLRDLHVGREGVGSEDQVRRVINEWKRWFSTYFDLVPEEYLSSPEADDDEDVTAIIDPHRPFTYDVQHTSVTGTGALSVDTLLDQVVFGLPVTSHDLWMKCHLHETSRRRNGECGINVVVASSS